jgi:hypothetical protein
LQRQQQQSTNSDISLFKKVLNNATTMDKLTAAVAAAVLIGGFVPFLDVLLATGWSTYLWWLLRLAQAPRRAEKDATVKVPKLPSLPPQGHVPLLVSNPLGYALSNSKKYQQWLDVGVILGLFGPILLLSRYTLWTAAPHNQLEAAAACARPLFWLCCHAMTEAVARNVLVCFKNSNEHHLFHSSCWHLSEVLLHCQQIFFSDAVAHSDSHSYIAQFSAIGTTLGMGRSSMFFEPCRPPVGGCQLGVCDDESLGLFVTHSLLTVSPRTLFCRGSQGSALARNTRPVDTIIQP